MISARLIFRYRLSMKVCLLSITASHYRARVYSEMDKQMDVDFIFGVDSTSVKRMDTSVLKKSIDVPNKYWGSSKWYYQSGVLSKTRKYDVIINDLGIFCLTAWLILIRGIFIRQKVYNWDHGWYGRENLIKKILKRIYFGLATGSFIYGDYAIRLMKENGLNGKKLFPIHNSLDYDSQLRMRKSIKKSTIYSDHFSNSFPVIIVIGRLNLRKKLNQLIDALSILKEQGRIFNLVLVGDGEDKVPLQQMVEKCQLSQQVWFYGACYEESTNAELILNADLCVVPGDIGLTAIHAMMFGIPVVTHDYYPNQGPEFEVIKEGITGSFFKHDDVKSLARTIVNWFELHSEDRESVRTACENEIDKNWTPQYQIDVLKKVIQSI